MAHVGPELSAHIQRLIDELDPGEALGNWPTRVCKDELNALPVRGNQIYLWALRPDGTVLCMDHEAFGHPTEPETSPVAVYAVLAHASRAHPELRELAPDPPEGVRPCGSCDGLGVVTRPRERPESCLGCSGLGWVA